ncbi:MAG: DNA repair protein RadA, partial [Deltaproteobacteria bacterium]|nr:DNA repair protein RadA [Deltaproteobacteria bacterium]
MSKAKAKFVCQDCGYVSTGYLGLCPHCGAWESFSEVSMGSAGPKSKAAAGGDGAVVLSNVPQENTIRLKTGIAEL